MIKVSKEKQEKREGKRGKRKLSVGAGGEGQIGT